jgi:cysteine synthase
MTEYEYLLATPDKISQNAEKWMAVIGNEVVAVSDSAKEVLARARELHPGKEPFVAKFPKQTAMLL